MIKAARTKKSCNKCYDRGYIGFTQEKTIVPCEKCVDTEKSYNDWKEYVKQNEETMLQQDYLLKEFEKIASIIAAIRQNIFGGTANFAITLENTKEILQNEINFDLDKFLHLSNCHEITLPLFWHNAIIPFARKFIRAYIY